MARTYDCNGKMMLRVGKGAEEAGYVERSDFDAEVRARKAAEEHIIGMERDVVLYEQTRREQNETIAELRGRLEFKDKLLTILEEETQDLVAVRFALQKSPSEPLSVLGLAKRVTRENAELRGLLRFVVAEHDHRRPPYEPDTSGERRRWRCVRELLAQGEQRPSNESTQPAQGGPKRCD